MASPRKTVLITGCTAGGIGGALAETFHEKGYYVFATLRDPSKVPSALSGSASATVLKLDVLSSESIAAAVEDVKRETGGKLDILINNSGRGTMAPALDASIEDGKKTFDLNYWAPLAMLQAFAPLLIKAKGCVVNNASASAYAPFPFTSVYASSKAALVAGSETWRHELRPLGVRTITLITTGVKSNAFVEPKTFEFPDNSPYRGLQDLARDLNNGMLQDGAMNTRQYAAKVVRTIESGAVGQVWVGKDAFAARLGWWLSPQWVFDMIVESVVPFSREMAKAAKGKQA
ncbi:related to 1-Acyl dihydroxyacetone phosphate reductase and related dehydrogenases [Cephalotrichum gorgonifer]|uniref:Related to 1-Acyl dihydroxyacetone phosphate reductase and related dehydrogenases n=1 Tax=Cephalotrichum gorgonifer TaxID=2041049 RepID=A0AAE8SSF3_9PEZI|nr:related to 1-Acyl dihydroxyacetone phosphate reductase and related dehydrogenases [Cephalotrichum gorgonifer]